DIAGSGGSGGGWDGSLGIDQGGNIDADPLFVDSDGPDNTPGTEDDDLRLMRFSPCIETGDYAAVPADTEDIDDDGNTGELVPWDLDRRPRIADGDCKVPALVDMGAYEFTLKFDLSDFAVFALHWAETGCDAGNGWCGSADMDRIDDVDDKDLRCFAEHWLLGLGL
ncbi:MAG: hypothetical protein KAR47_14625, partial [Planctomycetes bacterium]|nr:hypothetical protein [Planctomycetota bacterium]